MSPIGLKPNIQPRFTKILVVLVVIHGPNPKGLAKFWSSLKYGGLIPNVPYTHMHEHNASRNNQYLGEMEGDMVVAIILVAQDYSQTNHMLQVPELCQI